MTWGSLRHRAASGLALAVVIAACANEGASARPQLECRQFGGGVIRAIDWSPNGEWLGVAVGSGDQVTEIIALRAGGDPKVIARGAEISNHVVAADDHGGMYFLSVDDDGENLVYVDDAGDKSWPLSRPYNALEWTTSGLLGIGLTPRGAGGDRTSLVDVAVGQTIVESDRRDWLGASALAASPNGGVVAVAVTSGPAVNFELLGEVEATIEGGTIPSSFPIGLSSVGPRWLVHYVDGSSENLGSIDADGIAGPTLAVGYGILAFDVRSDGVVAAGSHNGPPEIARLCITVILAE